MKVKIVVKKCEKEIKRIEGDERSSSSSGTMSKRFCFWLSYVLCKRK